MTGTARKEQAERRRRQLLDVALEAFTDKGVENVSMADLAARAGVAHGLVYHYFAGKDDLLLAVLQHASPAPDLLGITTGMRGMSAAEGLRYFGEQLAEVLERRRSVIRLLLRESMSPRSVLPSGLAELQAQVLDGLGVYLQERVEAGELRAHDVRAPFRMLISSALVLAVTDQPVAPGTPAMVEVILSGIRNEENP